MESHKNAVLIAVCMFFLCLPQISLAFKPKTEPRADPLAYHKPEPEQAKLAPSPYQFPATNPKPKLNEPKLAPSPYQPIKSEPISKPKPEPKLAPPPTQSASPKPKPNADPLPCQHSIPKLPKPNLKPKPKPEPKTAPPPYQSYPKPKPKIGPPKHHSSTAKPKPNPNLKPEPKVSPPPYQLANHFCIHKRLNVHKTFCLRVLRSSPKSSKAKDIVDLLQIAVDSAVDFGNKTYVFLKNMSKDKKTMPHLKPVIRGYCLPAYEGFVSQFKGLMAEAKTEPAMATYDPLLAREELQKCSSALGSFKNEEILVRNKIAENHIKLCLRIADFLEI